LLAPAAALAQAAPSTELPPADTSVAPPADVPPAVAPVTPPAPLPPVATTPPPAPPVTTVPDATEPQGPVVATPPAPGNDEMLPTDPLAGWSGDTVYLRSADNEFQLMPGGRLQVDGYFFKRDTDAMPTPSILLRRARLEVAGWVGKYFFYNIGGDFALGAPAAADPVAQSWVATTDDFVGIAPWKSLAMLQVGQFDAPFTMENRTSDKYFDFMERSITVRAFGIPSNKETGAMINGLLPKKMAYYSIGIFDGDGQNFRNVDAKFDAMGRVYIAPFAMAGVKSLEDVEIGGSFWVGKRGNNGLRLASQTTQGGVTFLDPTWKITPTMGATTPVEVHQNGTQASFAAELNVPIEHKYGLRAEYVHKHQHLAVDDATTPAKLVELSPGLLDGWSMYGELYAWVLGDDTILPAPGLELQSRLKHFETKAPKSGVMIAARYEHLNEKISTDKAVTSDPLSGTHEVDSFTLGANYWYSKRYRATFNYVLNNFSGDAGNLKGIQTTLGGHKTDHEFLLRLAIAL
jgi:phosphate-selective porin